jgi:formylmethanofuran dehydrogenase subunit E
MTAPTTTLSDSDLEVIERFHGHICSMVLLGARMVRAASDLLPEGDGDRSLPFAFFRGYGCAVDGVQIMSGCTWGNGNLTLLRGADFSLLLTVENSPKAIKMAPLPDILSDIRTARGTILNTALGELILEGPYEELFTLDEITGLGELSRYPGAP